MIQLGQQPLKYTYILPPAKNTHMDFEADGGTKAYLYGPRFLKSLKEHQI